MFKQVRPALVMLGLLTLLTGVVYPLVVTGIGQVVFNKQANGSFIEQNGKIVGSELIGQNFDDPKYFWGRLSATSAFPYDASASSGSNLGPTNSKLQDAVKARMDTLKAADPTNTAPVPVDLVTASASGLDPQISPAAIEYQVRRVAQARGLDENRVQQVISQYTENRQLGILGEPTVNVLKLNLALDKLK